MADPQIVEIRIDPDELAKAMQFLNSQSYLSEYEVRLSMSVSGQSGKIIEALKDNGWNGALISHATDCDDEGWIYSCFDPDALGFREVDELVRDEAELQRRLRT